MDCSSFSSSSVRDKDGVTAGTLDRDMLAMMLQESECLCCSVVALFDAWMSFPSPLVSQHSPEDLSAARLPLFYPLKPILHI